MHGFLIISFFTAIISLDYYLFINIKKLTEGSSQALGLLGIVIVILIFSSFFQLLFSKAIYIKKSFLILLLFFTYVILKIIIDIGDADILKAATVSTTGGIILFYFIGAMISITLNKIETLISKSKILYKIVILFFGFYLLFHIYLLINCFIVFAGQLRNDLFLIIDLKGRYQRAGAFLTISSIILSSLYISVFLYSNRYAFLSKRILLIGYSFLLFISLLFSMIISQMIGSNNGLVSTIGLVFLNLFFVLFLSHKNKIILEKYLFRFKNIVFGKLGRIIISNTLITLIFLLIILIGVIKMTGFNINVMRIFSYGSGEVASIGSRIENLSNFKLHFFYSWYTILFGNMQIDTITGTQGNYVHSFLGSVLTHLGITGFIIIITFFILVFKEYLKIISVNLQDNGFRIYKTLLFCGFFLIANVGVFFTYVPMWFLIGIIFIPITNEKMVEV